MEENILIKVGNRLTALRKDTGKSQSDIAEILGVKIRSYAGYERAEHLPPTKVLLGLAGLYGVSIDYLLCLTDYRTGMDGEHFAKLTGLRDDGLLGAVVCQAADSRDGDVGIHLASGHVLGDVGVPRIR